MKLKLMRLAARIGDDQCVATPLEAHKEAVEKYGFSELAPAWKSMLHPFSIALFLKTITQGVIRELHPIFFRCHEQRLSGQIVLKGVLIAGGKRTDNWQV